MRRTLALAVLALLAACGGSPTTPTPSAAGSATPTAPPASPTPTPHPATTPLTVWVVNTAAGSPVRVAPTAGGAFHTVATLPVGALPITAGGHYFVADYPDGHLRAINLITGTTTDLGGSAGFAYWGGAFAPDGVHMAYVRVTSVTDPASATASLQVADVSTGSDTALKAFTSNTYDAPAVWGSTAIGAVAIVGFSDAGPVAVSQLDPHSGNRVVSTDTGGSYPQIALDATHAADSYHASLGDDGDSPGGPGPARPFNSMRGITIGGATTTLLSEAHHDIAVLALSADGSHIVFFDDSAAGGFAGISQSPDFGLFLWSGGHKTQLTHYGDHWDAAAFTGATTFVAAKQAGGTETLVAVDGTTVTTIDTASGTGANGIWSVTG